MDIKTEEKEIGRYTDNDGVIHIEYEYITMNTLVQKGINEYHKKIIQEQKEMSS